MTVSASDIDLIETLRWQASDGYYLLDRHLDRLENSAHDLGFTCDGAGVRDTLNAATTAFDSPVERVRLLLHRDGSTTLTHTPITLPDADSVLTFALSDKIIDSSDNLYRHKTTRRALFDTEREQLQRQTGCGEAVFVNERGELTEGSITTLFVEESGLLKTPPLSCGVLPGTLRAELLADGDRNVVEAVLTLPDLRRADKVYLGNSVRGLLEARQVSIPSMT